MMSRRTAGLCFANFFIVELMATVMTITRTIDQMRVVGFKAAMTAADSSSSLPRLTPAQVVLGCVEFPSVPVSGHAKGPLCERALVTYSGLERDLGRLQLGRHGTSPQGFVLLAAGDVCVRLARVHNVKSRIPNHRGMRSRRRRLDQCGFTVGSGSAPSMICLTKPGISVSPASRQTANAAVSWFSASSRSVKRGCGCRVTAAGLSFAGLIDQVDIDLPEEGHSLAVFDRRELLRCTKPRIGWWIP
jgi:hypothetical protein